MLSNLLNACLASTCLYLDESVVSLSHPEVVCMLSISRVTVTALTFCICLLSKANTCVAGNIFGADGLEVGVVPRKGRTAISSR